MRYEREGTRRGPRLHGAHDARDAKSVHANSCIVVVPAAPAPSGAARTFLRRAQGKRLDVVLDKLAERLAFERASVQLYDALARKIELVGTWSEGPSLGVVEMFRQDEESHVEMLLDAITLLGGDVEAVWPSARLVALETSGFPQVLHDTSTSLADCIHAVLAAELLDNDGWQLLLELSLAFGASSLANAVADARHVEGRHLEHLRVWLSNHAFRDAVTVSPHAS